MAASILGAPVDDDDSHSAGDAGSDSSDSSVAASCPAPTIEGVICGWRENMNYFATTNLFPTLPELQGAATERFPEGAPEKSTPPKGNSHTGYTPYGYSDLGTDLNIDCVSWCQSKATELNKKLFAAETYTYYRHYGEGDCPANEGGNCGDVCYCYEEAGCPHVCDAGMLEGLREVYYYSGTAFLQGRPSRGTSADCNPDEDA
jgi:hypothetical protein